MAEAKLSELPKDIILEVLVRLPAKALCRFRCVSKAWRALISDPTFVAAQRSHAGPHLVGVFFGDCRRRRPAEVRVMDMNCNVVRVLAMEVPALLGKDDDDGNHSTGVLQQATTRRLNDVIVHEEDDNVTIIDPAAGRACTVDTDAPEIMCCFFGYAAASSALKVVCLIPSQICKVATIVNNGGAAGPPLRWRQKSTPPFVSSRYPQRKATVNGVVYFLPPPPFNMYDVVASSSVLRIAAFDLESEEWKMINGPPAAALAMATQQEETCDFTLTEHKGTLCLAQFLRHRNVENFRAIIWLLIDSNKSVWVKEHTIQMPRTRTWGLMKLLGALDDDDGTILLLVREFEKVTRSVCRPRDLIVFYNPSTKTLTKFMDIAMGFRDVLFLYTGSLVFLDK